MTAFRLEEKLVCSPIGKFDHFVLDGRTVSRACPFDSPGVKRRLMEIASNDFVSAGGRLGNPTWHLFHVELSLIIVIECEHVISKTCHILIKRESWRRFVSRLDLALGEVDRATIESAGCTCLKSSNCETKLSQIFAQP